MKKFVKILFVFLLSSVVLCCATIGYAPQEDNRETIVTLYTPDDENPYLVKTYADGSPCDKPFKLITFSDPHFKGDKEKAGDAASLVLIENTIKQEKPDLIVFCGDIALNTFAEDAIATLGALLERYNQYWGYVLGNHDGEDITGPFREDLPFIYGEFKHCIIYPATGVSGDGNCIVNIKNSDGGIIQSLVFIDTGSSLDENICRDYNFEYVSGAYDFIKYDQIEWYKSEMRLNAERNGSMPASIMFIHIPLAEFQTAYDLAKQENRIIYGARNEAECPSMYNTGMFDAILELNSTRTVICGHDHINDYCVEYQGITLLYSQTSSFNSYFMRRHALFYLAYKYGQDVRFNDGHTEVMIHKDGTSVITPRLNQDNPSLFDGLSQEHRDELHITETLPRNN